MVWTMTTPEPRTAREVASLIRASIASGDYPRGSELPLQDALAERYGVNRATVSRAVGLLATEGLVQPIRGRRTIVTPIPPIVRNAAVRYSRAARERNGAVGAYDAEIRAMGLEPRVDLRVERVTPPARVAEILGVPADQVSAVIRARVMYAGDTVTQLADSYIPLDIAADTVLEQRDEGPGGMVSRMAEMGHAQVRVTERLQGRPSTRAESRALNIAEGQPVYTIEHVGWTAEGQAVEVALHTMPQHLWIIDTEFPCD